MENKDEFILGSWTRYPSKENVSGLITLSEDLIQAKFFNIHKGSFKDLNIKMISSTSSSHGEVTLFNLFNQKHTYRGNYEESWYEPQYILFGKSLKTDTKCFDSLSFSLESLHKFFSPGIQTQRELKRSKRNITIQEQISRLTQKSKIFDISINSSFTESAGREIGHQYLPYTRITLTFHHPINTRTALQYIQEIEDLFTFITRQHCCPKNIFLSEKKNPPNKLIIKDYLKPNNLRDLINPLFSLDKNSYLFKKILRIWPTIYKQKRLHFNLFSSGKIIKGQYLDNTFFDLMTIVDNELVKKYGNSLEYSKYKNIKHHTITKKLAEDKERKKEDIQKFSPTQSSFRDRLLRFLEENQYLYSKIHLIYPLSKTSLSNIEFNFKISDELKNLRDDIAHGDERRNGKYLYEYSLITRFLALHLLLENFHLSRKTISVIIQNLPNNYY